MARKRWEELEELRRPAFFGHDLSAEAPPQVRLLGPRLVQCPTSGLPLAGAPGR